MPISDQLRQRIRSAQYNVRSQQGPTPRYGDAIFAGDYPRTWDQLVGQEWTVTHLRASIRSAELRGVRLDHVLLASGLPGVGKSSIARLIAGELEVGFSELSGAVSVDEARVVLRGMADGDVLFYDEIHQAVAGGKAKAEWLLHLLQDGRLVTAGGVEGVPDICVVAATTDAQRLPLTILSRFPIKPVLESYTEEEALEIAHRLAVRMGMGGDLLPMPDEDVLVKVAAASNGSPRSMKSLLGALRDVNLGLTGDYDMDRALRWCGVSHDGLDQLAQDYLITLMVMCSGRAGAATIAAALSEPGPLAHTEQVLAQKGLIEVTPNGRQLTEAGTNRTITLLSERGLLDS